MFNDVPQSGTRVMKTGWQLEEETAHVFSEQIGDITEIADQFFGAAKPFYVRNQFANFNGVNEFAAMQLLDPRTDGCCRWPRIERRIQFHRVEAIGVMIKPCLCWEAFWIKFSAPMPIKPAGAADESARICKRPCGFLWYDRLNSQRMHLPRAQRILCPLFFAARFAPRLAFDPRLNLIS